MRAAYRRQLSVVVRLVPEACLWSWEIHDEREAVESGWTARWEAFETRDAAQAAGERRLAEITRGSMRPASYASAPRGRKLAG